MPRGKKNLTLQEQIDKTNAEIEVLEAKLKEKKAERKALEKKKISEDMDELQKFIAEKGISVSEIKEKFS